MNKINLSQETQNVLLENQHNPENTTSPNKTDFDRPIEQSNQTKELQNTNPTNINDTKLEERTTHANVVPVITNAESLSKEDREKIYDVIAHYSFVTFLNPNNAFDSEEQKAKNSEPAYQTTISGIKINSATGTPDLSDEEKELLINDEGEFLTQKIKEVCKDATLAFVPKSLYQLSIYSDYVTFLLDTANTLFKQTEGSQQDITDKPIHCIYIDLPDNARQLSESFGNAIDKYCSGTEHTNTSAQFAPKANDLRQKTLPAISRDYNMLDSVQTHFWQFNTTLAGLINIQKDLSTKRYITINALNNIIDALAKKIAGVYRDIRNITLPNKTDSKTYIMSILSPFDCFDYANEPTIGEPELSFIKKLIELEYQAPTNTYRIYRGEAPSNSFIKYSQYDSSVSCSDGLFAGAVFDGDTGSAYKLSKAQERCLTYIDIPKEHLINDPQKQYFFIPPVLAIGAAMGNGEHHHVRGKIYQENSTENRANDDSTENSTDDTANYETSTYIRDDKIDVDAKTAPYLYTTTTEPFDNFKKNSDIETITIEGTGKTVTAISFPKGL